MFLYKIAIQLYGLAIRLSSPFAEKAQKWVAGRNGWKQSQKILKQTRARQGRPLLWMHCASLGEFEQGRPIIEKVRQQQPEWQILLTFFSPSGYEIRKAYEGADFITYLPLDHPANARHFVDLWNPDLVIFIKYEFWYYYFRALHRSNTPILMAAALFRPGQMFFKWYGKPFQKMLGWVQHFFLQNQASAQQLNKLGMTNYTVCGDPRVDRVWSIAQQAPSYPIVEQFAQQSDILIAGSTWPEDEAILLPLLNRHWPEGWKAIIAPHHINDKQIEQFRKKLTQPSIRYSQAEDADLKNNNVLIIDNIGMLSALYQYGRIAYIGGGFGAGLHNTLEPIAFGLPVLFGTGYHKFEEARYLVASGGGKAVADAPQLKEAFHGWLEEHNYQKASQQAAAYILKNRGASDAIVRSLPEFIPGRPN